MLESDQKCCTAFISSRFVNGIYLLNLFGKAHAKYVVYPYPLYDHLPQGIADHIVHMQLAYEANSLKSDNNHDASSSLCWMWMWNINKPNSNIINRLMSIWHSKIIACCEEFLFGSAQRHGRHELNIEYCFVIMSMLWSEWKKSVFEAQHSAMGCLEFHKIFNFFFMCALHAPDSILCIHVWWLVIWWYLTTAQPRIIYMMHACPPNPFGKLLSTCPCSQRCQGVAFARFSAKIRAKHKSKA